MATTDESVYTHDWRFCECRECDLIKNEYAREMGE